MQKSNYEVDILVNGKKIEEYLHNGKVYIEGKESTKYSIRVKNNSWRRIKAVISVDGLSVISGKFADYDSIGYIISAHSSLTIDGWRKNDKEVAEFYFSNMEESYSTKVGKGGNQGVIGVAVFEEKQETLSWTTQSTYLSPSSFTGGTSYNIQKNTGTTGFVGARGTMGTVNSSASGSNVLYCSSAASTSMPSQDLGTGWGQVKRSEVVKTEFEADKNSMSMFQIFYSTKKELEKAGINVNKVVYISQPQAFPGEFCEEPKR